MNPVFVTKIRRYTYKINNLCLYKGDAVIYEIRLLKLLLMYVQNLCRFLKFIIKIHFCLFISLGYIKVTNKYNFHILNVYI